MVSKHAWREFFKSSVWTEIEEELKVERDKIREELDDAIGEDILRKQSEVKKIKQFLTFFDIQKTESEEPEETEREAE